MTKVENKQFNISTDNQNYFRIESEGSIMSAEASSQQSLNRKVNLTRVLSEPIFYQMPQNNIKPVAPEKSIIKSPSITSEIKKSRKRCVSFSTHLREEIIDMPKMKENSDSECEDYETCLDVQHEEMNVETTKCVSEYTLRMHSLYLNRRPSLESFDIRPPTPPNTSHLLKPISAENPTVMIGPDAIVKEN